MKNGNNPRSSVLPGQANGSAEPGARERSPGETHQPPVVVPHPAGDPPFLGESNYIRDRIAGVLDRLREAIHPFRHQVATMEVAGPVGRIPYDEATRLSFRPVHPGEEFGPTFATYWFRLELQIPEAWQGRPVDLAWNSHSEACLWKDGEPLQGLNPGREFARLTNAARGEREVIYVEMACNHLLGRDGTPGLPFPKEPVRSAHWLQTCEVRAVDLDAWNLYHDLRVLAELETDRSPPQFSAAIGNSERPCVRPALDNAWAGKLLYDLNQVCNQLDPADPTTWPAARQTFSELLGVRNGGIAHQLSAVGHAHIDTAWLWPLEETYRKTVRTFSSALRYMEDYPEFRFAVSQAYQYEQIEQRDPKLFERIRAKVADGGWLPVGGTYIEPDCNLPAGESLCRQFVFGQRYFQSRFGQRCREFWNPDVFGYNGQLPQIMRLAGIEFFLTQKLSWNRFTTPDHHTFYWQGLDGTRVLTHFPPADTYNGVASVAELRYHAANYKDADRGTDALYLFGHGDGGGGPTPEMLETLRRSKDLLGVPPTTIREPIEFFERLERRTRSIPTVTGELYFELHRGTYTSQAEMKRGLRDGERLLHDIEFLGTLATTTEGEAYPQEQVEQLWKRLLLNQFHDILPGSSIREVHETARADYDWIREQGNAVRAQLKRSLGESTEHETALSPLNPVGHARSDVEALPDGDLIHVQSPAYGFGVVSTSANLPPDAVVVVEQSEDTITLSNEFLSARLDVGGELLSLEHRQTGRQALSGCGNRLRLHDDHPSLWDAWDVEPSMLETGRDCPPAENVHVTGGGLRGEATFVRRVGQHSELRQTVRLDARSRRLEFHCEVDWHEQHQLLRVEFPVAVLTPQAAFETAFGSVTRPTHMNTAADKAMFETPGHRWADLSQPDFGVSLLTDYKHGFSTAGQVLGLSLLRAPTYPDETCDQGRHVFKYAVMPHAEDWRQANVLAEAVAFSHSLLWAPHVPAYGNASIVSTEGSSLVCDTVKPADDGQGVMLRLYEPYGRSGTAEVKVRLPASRAWQCNLLEDNLHELPLVHDSGASGVATLKLTHRPFQILTLRLLP
ncbi:MAG: glycoside hydrolase family 38 C-terminal domain-containing protein [Planctomycetota bacterium]